MQWDLLPDATLPEWAGVVLGALIMAAPLAMLASLLWKAVPGRSSVWSHQPVIQSH